RASARRPTTSWPVTSRARSSTKRASSASPHSTNGCSRSCSPRAERCRRGPNGAHQGKGKTKSETHPPRPWLGIEGRVQGVGFRFSALDEARRLGVTGWVRNTADGDVELLAEGDEGCLRRLATWCHAGPPGARVTHVEQQWLAFSGAFDSFRIR